MSKMVEDLDEVNVSHNISSLTDHFQLNACWFMLQVAGLQYKKFLAFPWILTVTWPIDTVSSL